MDIAVATLKNQVHRGLNTTHLTSYVQHGFTLGFSNHLKEVHLAQAQNGLNPTYLKRFSLGSPWVKSNPPQEVHSAWVKSNPSKEVCVHTSFCIISPCEWNWGEQGFSCSFRHRSTRPHAVSSLCFGAIFFRRFKSIDMLSGYFIIYLYQVLYCEIGFFCYGYLFVHNYFLLQKFDHLYLG